MKPGTMAVLIAALVAGVLAAAIATRDLPRPQPAASPRVTASPQPQQQQRVVFVPAHANPASPQTPALSSAQPRAPATGGPPTTAPAPAASSGAASPAALAASAPPPSGAPFPIGTLAPNATLPAISIQPANAPPQILAVSLSEQVVHAGDVVSAVVETSSNVASVEAHIAGQSATLEKAGVGKFTLDYRVPRLPFFLHRTYLVQIVARNTGGEAVSTAVPITIR